MTWWQILAAAIACAAPCVVLVVQIAADRLPAPPWAAGRYVPLCPTPRPLTRAERRAYLGAHHRPRGDDHGSPAAITARLETEAGSGPLATLLRERRVVSGTRLAHMRVVL